MKLSMLKEALSNIIRKPITKAYPITKTDIAIPESHRGLHYVDFYKCTGCSLCAIDCPSNAIQMTKIELKLGTNPKNLYPIIDYEKCVFCYHCVYICPVKAYITTNNFELAGSPETTSLNFSMKNLQRGEIK
ncbi:MAG: 4Fe-4S binding protein [Fervidicoccaceae archaeon]